MSEESQQSIAIYRLSQEVATLRGELNETREVVNQLAGIEGVEWVKELKKLVSKEKLEELRKNPR